MKRFISGSAKEEAAYYEEKGVFMMGKMTSADKCHLISIMMGDANDIDDEDTQIRNMAKTLMIMIHAIDTSCDFSATNAIHRPKIAPRLRDLWLPRTAGKEGPEEETRADFERFLEHKVMNWVEEEMIEECAAIAQSPLILKEEYWKLLQSRQESANF